jgi:hypothetical protein
MHQMDQKKDKAILLWKVLASAAEAAQRCPRQNNPASFAVLGDEGSR